MGQSGRFVSVFKHKVIHRLVRALTWRAGGCYPGCMNSPLPFKKPFFGKLYLNRQDGGGRAVQFPRMTAPDFAREWHSLGPPKPGEGFEKILVGPNQGGKTYTGAKEVYWCLRGDHPFRRVRKGPVEWWAVCTTHKQSLAVHKTLNKVIPRSEIVDYDFNDSRGFLNGIIRVRCKDDPLRYSTLTIKTIGQDNTGLASATLHGIWCDEPVPKQNYDEISARLLVNGGELLFTFTAVGIPVDYLQEKVEKGEIPAVTFGLTVDNCPHLSQKKIDMQAKRYLKAQFAQRFEGKWGGLADGYYISGYTEENFKDPVLEGRFQIGFSADHGERPGSQYFALFAYRSGSDPFMYVFDEWQSDRATTPEEDADQALAMLKRNNLSVFDVDLWIGDINSAGKMLVGVSVNEVLAKAIMRKCGRNWGHRPPLYFEPADKRAGAIDYGARIISFASLQGRFYVSPRCPLAHKCLSYWQNDGSRRDAEFKHTVDTLRYGAIEVYSTNSEYSTLYYEYA